MCASAARRLIVSVGGGACCTCTQTPPPSTRARCTDRCSHGLCDCTARCVAIVLVLSDMALGTARLPGACGSGAARNIGGARRACAGSGAGRAKPARAISQPDDPLVTCNGAAVAKLRALLAQPGLLQVWQPGTAYASQMAGFDGSIAAYAKKGHGETQQG